MSDSVSPRETPVCDLQAALVRLDGDDEMLRMLMSVFHEDAPQLLAQLDEGSQKGDLRTVERSAHSLKGLAANFDGILARDAAQAVESLARMHQTEGLEEAIAGLRMEIKRLRERLKAS